MIDPVLFIIGFVVLTPIVGLFLVILPVYAGMYASLYWMYFPEEGMHPMAEQFTNYTYVLAQYEALYDFWSQQAAPNLMEVTLPIFLPPVLGILFSILALFWFLRKVRNMFGVDDL